MDPDLGPVSCPRRAGVDERLDGSVRVRLGGVQQAVETLELFVDGFGQISIVEPGHSGDGDVGVPDSWGGVVGDFNDFDTVGAVARGEEGLGPGASGFVAHGAADAVAGGEKLAGYLTGNQAVDASDEDEGIEGDEGFLGDFEGGVGHGCGQFCWRLKFGFFENCTRPRHLSVESREEGREQYFNSTEDFQP